MGVILGFLATLFVGVLAGMGVGSGGLYLLYLTWFTDTPQREAQGLNLAFFVFALSSSVLLHALSGMFRDRRLLLCIPLGMAGAGLGAFTAGFLPAVALKRILGVVFLIAGIFTLYRTGLSYIRRKKSGKKGMARRT